jgi:hypothetical protein
MQIRIRFPEVSDWSRITYLSVMLDSGAHPTICGFGKPFINPVDPEVEGWINANKPIIEGVTMMDVLQQRVFRFVVNVPCEKAARTFSDQLLPPVFEYGYPAEQPVEKEAMISLADGNPGDEFQPSYGQVFFWATYVDVLTASLVFAMMRIT